MYNIKDNPNWTLVYDWDNGWDYYEVQARDASSAPLGRPIRVYKDCRPIKHVKVFPSMLVPSGFSASPPTKRSMSAGLS